VCRIDQDVYFRRPENESDVYQVLTNLPRGLPSSLWGMEIDELVSAIMKAKYGLTPKGYPIMKIKDRWYRADIDDLSTYLQPYEGRVIEQQ